MRSKGVTLKSAVAAGNVLLDQHNPGWGERIVRPVEVNSMYDCPIGQVTGDFSKHARGLFEEVAGVDPLSLEGNGLFWTWCYDHGFACSASEQTVAGLLWETAAILRRPVTA